MRYKVYVDGTDAAYHIPEDAGGVRVYFSVDSLKKHNKCWQECGITELVVDCNNPKTIVEADHELAIKNAITGDQIAIKELKQGPKLLWRAIRRFWWSLMYFPSTRYYRIKHKILKRRD